MKKIIDQLSCDIEYDKPQETNYEGLKSILTPTVEVIRIFL